MIHPAVILKKGTLLYRCVPMKDWLHNDGNICPDTGKKGLYFGTYPLLAIAIAVETGAKQSFLGVFETTKDIPLFDGKYSFREIEGLDKYYYRDGTMRFNVMPEQHPNHFDNVEMILDPEYDSSQRKQNQDAKSLLQGEVFLGADRDDAHRSLTQIATYELPCSATIIKTVKKFKYFHDRKFDRSVILEFLTTAEQKHAFELLENYASIESIERASSPTVCQIQ
jgi:hypothetical protein